MNSDRFKHAAALIRSIIAVGVSFQILDWTDSQIGVVMMAVEALGALIYAGRVKASNGSTPSI